MTIECRLKEERNRLGFNQSDFAGLAGRTKKTMIDYEKGVSSPDAKFLAAIAIAGADVQYILTGIRKPPSFSISSNDDTPIVEAMDEQTMKKRKAIKMAELFEALSDTQQREILAAVEEKKRINELVEIINQLRGE